MDEYNPFMNYRFNVVFTHKASRKSYTVPGYFAADGKAGETSATSGNKWRVHFAPGKTGKDLRGKGRLQYNGTRYLNFAETGKQFLKVGPDAPENFLAFEDFDGIFHNDEHKNDLVKTWDAHLKHWNKGDTSWQNSKGKAIIGAINYLSSAEYFNNHDP
jgi:hypothetical protein